MQEARGEILNDFDLGNEDLLVVGYDEVVERAEAVEQERIEEYEVDNLAHDLDQFGYDYDPFGYSDNYTSRAEGLNEIRKGLLEGKNEGIKVFLQDIIGDDDTKNAIIASNLCSRIEVYERKQLAKEPVQKEEKHSVLQELNSLKADAGERVVSCHYVDSFGFAELLDFMKPENYLKNAEMAMEDDYGMIDGIINNGKAPATEEKPSVLEKLKEQPVADTPKKSSRHSMERDME